ncbi:MAG: phosphoribosylglycinamide formyltransferase [Bacteroidia bacterium]
MRTFAAMKRIAIFASGTGSNARRLMEYFEMHDSAQVILLVCNRAEAGVVAVAHEAGVEVLIVDRELFYTPRSITQDLHDRGIDFIVLAGFLWLIPEVLVQAYSDVMVNIHPALLPKFGGKGMYGMRVHEAVIAAGEKESGITIHYVDSKFDEGAHIAQFSCPVFPNDTASDLAMRVQELEHVHFCEVIDRLVH